MLIPDVHGIIHRDVQPVPAFVDLYVPRHDADHEIPEGCAVAAGHPVRPVQERHADVRHSFLQDLHPVASDQDRIPGPGIIALARFFIAYGMKPGLPAVSARNYELDILVPVVHHPLSADGHQNIFCHQYSSISIFCAFFTRPGRIEAAKSVKLSARSLTKNRYCSPSAGAASACT